MNLASSTSNLSSLSSGLAPLGDSSAYLLKTATSQDEVREAQRLRYVVFNLELNEGLEDSSPSGLDIDAFDAVCEHLLVIHRPTLQVVGTYRLQTGLNAVEKLGYYSEQEFDFSPYETLRPKIIELGRACVQRDHRNISVLHLLWRGIARYAQKNGARYLMGCSSLTSQDSALGHAMHQRLQKSYLAEASLRTVPRPDFALMENAPLPDCPPPPKLLRAYLMLGAKICGPPALDRAFKTIDFLTLLDLEALPAIVRNHFLI